MSNENEKDTGAPEVTLEENKIHKTKKIPIFALVSVLAAVCIIAGVGYWFKQDISSESKVTPPMVVVLDSAQLAMLRLDRVREENMDKDQAQEEAQMFARELGAILSEYQSNGIVVLNKSVVLSTPKQFDITPLVAERLGIDIKLVEQ